MEWRGGEQDTAESVRHKVISARSSDDAQVIALQPLDPSSYFLIVQFLVGAHEPLQCGMVNVDRGVRVGDVDIELLHDSKVQAVRLDFVSVPSKLLMCEAVREGGNQPFGTVVVLLVEYSAAAV